ncbi:MAG: alpha/beta fold hydrolase [Leptolyngbyaceae cyanobacterium CSU_1_3]|nr:alpha/beta fold hydrolase [Leptolyngbyaceae cyanobacterium CSU_1_3]
MTRYFYLHGFASSPRSSKAQDFVRRFRAQNLDLQVPDLNQGDFTHLTLTRQLQQVQAEFLPGSITVIGSSLGGLTAAWLGQRCPQVDRLVLLAPAFDFLAHWLPKLGENQLQQWRSGQPLAVYHHGEERLLPLDYQFVADCVEYDQAQLQRSIPTLILHGIHDDVIPVQASRDYGATRPWVNLVELNSDHGLAEVKDQIWSAVQEFCFK